MAASPSLGSGHQRRQGVGDRPTAAFAGNGPSKLTVWVDQIDEGAVVIQIAAIFSVIPLVKHMKGFCCGGDLRWRAGKANETRIKGFRIFVQNLGGVSLRIDSNENRLHRVRARAESFERACDFHYDCGADIGADCVAKIDDEPFAAITLLCNRGSIRRSQGES